MINTLYASIFKLERRNSTTVYAYKADLFSSRAIIHNGRVSMRMPVSLPPESTGYYYAGLEPADVISY